MSWYEFLLFVHIATAATWVGGAAMIQFFALRAIGSDDPTRLSALARDVEWISTRVLIPASLLTVVAGVVMVVDADFWSFGDDWIVIGLILFAITFLAGALFFGPESGRIGKLIEAEGASSTRAQARVQRILALSRADLMLLFLIIFDMAVKPSINDVSLYVAVAVAAVIAAILVRHGLSSQTVASASAD